MIRISKSVGIAAWAVSAGFGASAGAAEVKYELSATIRNFVAWSANDAGQIAGWTSFPEQAALYSPGQGLSSLPMPTGAVDSIGYKINAAGQVGGILDYGSSYWGPTYKSFIYSPKMGQTELLNSMTIGIDSALAPDGTPYLLNAGGPTWAMPGSNVTTDASGNYAVGYSAFNDRSWNGAAWIRQPDGTFNSIGHQFPLLESQAYGVNDAGVAVGRVIPNLGPLSAFVYVDGGAYDLFKITDPASRGGWSTFLSAQDVNNNGVIVGWGVYSGSIASFVLTPLTAVPEPVPAILMLSGLGLLVTRRSRTRSTITA